MLRYGRCDRRALSALLARLGLKITRVDAGRAIPASFWGEPEAGLTSDTVWVRDDTPVHSILHETGHYICMDEHRRSSLGFPPRSGDAGGDYDEENAVCYLQIVMADILPDMDRHAMFRDMDAWGYTFRLGSSKAWFERDSSDARSWLTGYGLLSAQGGCTFRLRKSAMTFDQERGKGM